MTTLKDIAAAAGVSIGTVDRALKDRGAGLLQRCRIKCQH